jgi:hypothetical protein
MRLLQENQKEYIETDMIQNVAEGNQVIIKEEEVERALKYSKSNKAPRPGGIPIELLKYGGKNVITFLMDRFNEMLVGEGTTQNEIPHTYAVYIKRR